MSALKMGKKSKRTKWQTFPMHQDAQPVGGGGSGDNEPVCGLGKGASCSLFLGESSASSVERKSRNLSAGDSRRHRLYTRGTGTGSAARQRQRPVRAAALVLC